MINVAFIPLDNRPVSYLLPKEIALLNNDIALHLPPREITGSLTEFANVEKIFEWLNEVLQSNKIDYIVCSLDIIAYGGLIPSRRSNESKNAIIDRLERFKNLVLSKRSRHPKLSSNNGKPKIYAFSTVMRISNNNINEEEKLYWDKHGESIFQYSYLSHQNEIAPCDENTEKLNKITSAIPQEVLDDYITTRERNFEINRLYFDWANENFIDYLVFSQDDTAKYGLNVKEANFLKEFIKNNNLSGNCCVKTGADEIPTDLLARGITEFYNTKIKVYPEFLPDTGKNIISRYEDVTIYDSVIGQIELCGGNAVFNKAEADIVLVVHTPQITQNDHAMQIYTDKKKPEQYFKTIKAIKDLNKPFIIVDVAYANGADNSFIALLRQSGINLQQMYGFAAWNTTGNSLGSAISTGLCRYAAELQNKFSLVNFKEALFTRFCDDWAYQSLVRQEIRAKTNDADEKILNELMQPYARQLQASLALEDYYFGFSFPWNRTFEVEIGASKCESQ